MKKCKNIFLNSFLGSLLGIFIFYFISSCYDTYKKNKLEEEKQDYYEDVLYQCSRWQDEFYNLGITDAYRIRCEQVALNKIDKKYPKK